MNRLVLQSACVHGYFGNCHFTDYTTPDPVVCTGGSERVVDQDIAAEVVRELVDEALGADSE